MPARSAFTRLDEILLVALVALGFVGVAFTDFATLTAYWYWSAMSLVFGACAYILHARHADDQSLARIGRAEAARRLTIHWLGVLGAVQLVYLLISAGRLDNIAADYTILLVFALGTFASGVVAGWRLSVVGLFLAAELIIIAYIEEYMWVLGIFALAVAAVIFVGARAYRKRERELEPSERDNHNDTVSEDDERA